MSTAQQPDPFHAPSRILIMKDDLPDETAGVRDVVGALVNGTSRALDVVALPFAGMAGGWKAAADARDAQRTPEARDAMMDANRAHRDTMRDLRSDRKAFEKARKEVHWANVFNGERRAARAVVRDSRALAREAAAVRREVKAAYPMTLPALAARCHAAHLAPTALWATVSDSYASTGVFSVSVAAVALNAIGVALGMRHVRNTETAVAEDALQPSQEESDLLQRLDATVWAGLAAPRGLSDVVPAKAYLTESGIQAKLSLNDQMTLDKLSKMEDQIRAALRLATDTRLELRPDKHGGRVRLTLRTRSAADSVDMTGWRPGDAWAVNTVTGETVPVPLGKRLLFAGGSGTGKSWSARPLMAEASEHDDHRLIIFDRKHIEARNWEHRARVACELDDMRELCEELTAEGESRLKLIPRGSDVVEISTTRPRITVFVDEGGELISDSKTKHPKDEEGRKDYDDIMSTMRTIARKYRAAEIILVWCTQKPALSGEGHGLDSQIAGQLMHRLSLALATSTDTQVVFGPDAIEKNWKANELPMPGYALFRDQEKGPKSVPQVLKMRAMSPKDVIALPARTVWRRSTAGATGADVAARKALEAVGTSDPWADGADDLGETDTVPQPVKAKAKPVAAADRDDQIIAALRANPCVKPAALARTLGMHGTTVKRSLDRLAADGLVIVDCDGCWSSAA